MKGQIVPLFLCLRKQGSSHYQRRKSGGGVGRVGGVGGWGCIYSFPGSSWSGSPLSRKKGLLETLAGLTGRAGKMGTPKHTAETPEP